MIASTLTDPLPPRWLGDGVFRLREWADERFHLLDPLLEPKRNAVLVGTARTCAITLRDASGLMSREHARLEKRHDQWYVASLVKNGIYLDGAKREKCMLSPGAELGLGRVTLVAESHRMIELRKVFARLLGWAPERREALDIAMQTLRAGTMRRAITLLCGDGNLVPVVEELHKLTLPDRPFVLCHPRQNRDSGEPAPARAQTGLEAIAQAAGGTVCVMEDQQPPDLEEALRELARPASNVRLIICAQRTRAAKLFHARPIVLPSLRRRGGEIERVIDEYAALAQNHFQMDRFVLESADRAWLRRHHGATLAEIQRATHRLAAIYKAGSIPDAATLLGITRFGLVKWLKSRRFDFGLPR